MGKEKRREGWGRERERERGRERERKIEGRAREKEREREKGEREREGGEILEVLQEEARRELEDKCSYLEHIPNTGYFFFKRSQN